MVRFLAIAAVLLASIPAQAGCRLALLLALDVSSSVDEDEDRLQRLGLANALISPEVEQAFLSDPGQSVALAIYEWSGRYQQDILLDWVELHGPGDLLNVAEAIRSSRISC